jgi:hypothetical protein
MAITYGCISAYGTLRINANTDNSGDEYVILTAGKGLSSSTSDGLAVGTSTLTWQGNTVLTGGNYSSYCLPKTGGTASGGLWSHKDSGEATVGVSNGTTGGTIYFYANNASRGIYDNLVGTVIGINGNSATFNGTANTANIAKGLTLTSTYYGSSVPSRGTAGQVYIKTTGASTAWKKVSVTTSAGEADITCSGVTTSSAVIATRNCTGAGGNYAQLLGGCYTNGKIHVGNIPGSTLGANTYNVTVWWSK